MDKITIAQIREIKGLKESCETIGEWKVKMAEKAREYNLTDQDILEINRSSF